MAQLAEVEFGLRYSFYSAALGYPVGRRFAPGIEAHRLGDGAEPEPRLGGGGGGIGHVLSLRVVCQPLRWLRHTPAAFRLGLHDAIQWLFPLGVYNCRLDTDCITILSETYVGKLPTSIDFAILVGIFPT